MIKFKKSESPVTIILMDTNEVDLLSLEQKFELSTPHKILSFRSPGLLLDHLKKQAVGSREICIAVISLEHLNSEKSGQGVNLLKQIRDISHNIEMVILASPDVEDMQVKAIQSGAFTAIRKSDNSFLRIQNAIKWIISQKEMKQKRQMAIGSLFIFLFLCFMTLLIWAIFSS
jgi:DNA-binding NtrC family response regulator